MPVVMMFLMLAAGNVHGVPIEFTTSVIPAPAPGVPIGMITVSATLPDYVIKEPGRIRVEGQGYSRTLCPVAFVDLEGKSQGYLFSGASSRGIHSDR
jgi:hypothetical protein